MAIAFIQGASNGAPNAGPVTVTLDATPATDDLILVFFTDGDTTDNAMPAGSALTPTFTDIASSEQYANSTNDCNSRAYYRYSTASETTITVPDTGGGANDGVSCVVMIFRGVALPGDGGPFSTTPTFATGNTSANADNPSIATAAGDVVVIMGGCAQANNIGTVTAPANYTTNAELGTAGADTNASVASMAYRDSGLSNPEDPPAWSVSTSVSTNSWNAVTLALKEAPAAAPFPVLHVADRSIYPGPSDV